MDEKKVSFGFAKNNKKPSLLPGSASSVSLKKEDSKQRIDCLVGQSIKVIGETEKEPAPLVISLREQDKTTIPNRLAKVLGIKQEVHEKLNSGQQLSVSTDDTNGESKKDMKVKLEPPENREVNVVHEPPKNEALEHETRRNLESIQQFMQKTKKFIKYGGDWVRLGADCTQPSMRKAMNAQSTSPAEGETLAMKCGAQVKVLAGKHKDGYGTVENIDEETSRVIGIKQEIQEKLNNGQQLSISTDDTNGESKKDMKVKLEPPERGVNVVHKLPKKETLELRATREILEDTQQANVKSEQSSNFVVPLLPEDLPLDGARESSMDDYESVPILKFGQAMLRGMGWKDPDPKELDPKAGGPDFVMHPVGIGLGADRAMKEKAINAHLIPPAQGETLAMKCGAQVKVFAGKYKDAYGTVESFDEHNNRVIVKFAIGGATESVNECLVMLVSKQEYNQYAKILNAAKYEEFKNCERPKASSKDDRSERADRSPNERRSRERDRKDRSEDSYREDREHPTERSLSQRHDREHEERYVSPVGFSTSDSDAERDRQRSKHKKSSSSYVRTLSGTKKKSHKYKQRRERREERDDSSYGRRDQRGQGSDSESDGKHHKKKTKKSKKPRSRSRSRR